MRPRSNVPQITQHAYERYQEHWKPAGTPEQVRAELAALAAAAGPTKQKTLVGDATVWRAAHVDGQVIPLAVRKHRNNFIVVTVLAPGSYDAPSSMELDAEQVSEREADLAYMRQIANERDEREAAEAHAKLTALEKEHNLASRQLSAQQVVSNYTAGGHQKVKAVERACEVLGLSFLRVRAQRKENEANRRATIVEKWKTEEAGKDES